MSRFIIFASFIILIQTFKVTNGLTIYIDHRTPCIVPSDAIGPSNFQCIVADDELNTMFNSTHAWYTEGSLKCVATIDKIIELAKKNCYRVVPTTIGAPPKAGLNRNNGRPIDPKDTFN